MGLYDRHVLPRLVTRACSASPVRRQREKVIPLARGRVLEVGLGAGFNLPWYDPARVEAVWGLDPSATLGAQARAAAAAVPFEVRVLGLSAERVPMEDATFDTVVVTYTLCTIPDARRALLEMRRVLRPGGELLFIEHGRAPDADVRRWQDRLTPAWRRLGGGCHLNRDIPALLAEAGFRLARLETMYLPGWRPLNYNFWGAAVPR